MLSIDYIKIIKKENRSFIQVIHPTLYFMEIENQRFSNLLVFLMKEVVFSLD
jgi:hypothetical protein